MKLSKSTIVCFLLIWIISPCYSQGKLFDSVWTDLKKVEILTKDPVIVIGPEKTHSINTIKIKSNSNVIAWEWYYMFYKQGNKNHLIKYVEIQDDFDGKKIYKSQSIEFVNDTLFGWLNSKKQHIDQEEILPFIYLDTIQNVQAYRQGFLMHTFPFGLSVHFPTDSSIMNFSSFRFDQIAMQLTLMPGYMDVPKNLNFEHNRQLNIFQLYILLNTMLTNYAEKFKFL